MFSNVLAGGSSTAPLAGEAAGGAAGAGGLTGAEIGNLGELGSKLSSAEGTLTTPTEPSLMDMISSRFETMTGSQGNTFGYDMAHQPLQRLGSMANNAGDFLNTPQGKIATYMALQQGMGGQRAPQLAPMEHRGADNQLLAMLLADRRARMGVGY